MSFNLKPSKNGVYLVISIISLYIANSIYNFYFGKTLDYSVQNIQSLIVFLLVSSICYYLSFAILLYLSFTSSINKYSVERKLYILVLIISIITTTFQILINNQNHFSSNTSSSYNNSNNDSIKKMKNTNYIPDYFRDNTTIFKHLIYDFIIFNELVLISLTVMYFFFFKRNLKSFIPFVIGLLIMTGVITNSMTNFVIYDWTLGIDNKEMLLYVNNKGIIDQNDTICSIDPNRLSTPYASFLPNRVSRHLLDIPQMCYDESLEFSRLTPNNYLMIFQNDCTKNTTSNYTLTPNFFREQRAQGVFKQSLVDVENDIAPFHRIYPYKGMPTKVAYDETVLVQCPGRKDEVHFQNIKKPNSLKRASHFNEPTLNKVLYVANDTAIPMTKAMNIMLLNFEGLSRAQFKRALPHTFKALQNIQDIGESRVFQFFRYHSLGIYGAANSAAMYCGYNSLHYSKEDAKLEEMVQFLAHSWTRNPMFYQSFRNDSYVKAWVNGICADWFNDNFGKPNDGSLDHELILPFCSPEMHSLTIDINSYKVGPYSYSRRCLGSQDSTTLVINYLKQYWKNYKSVGKIISVNLMDAMDPSLDVLSFSDPAFSEYFNSEEFHSLLNDTLVVLVGTHGNPDNWLYDYTDVGKLESTFPLLNMIFPRWFLNAHPEVEKNLASNENRLSTPFQLYHTLRYLSKYAEFGGIDMMDYKNQVQVNGFLSEIPKNVKCKDLGIPHDICSCK